MATRIEKDSLGSIRVPKSALYGASTQRSINNFKISNTKWNISLIKAIAQIKKSCVNVNSKLGYIDLKKKKAIERACNEIIRGKHQDQFPLDIYQAGSGTSTHMNVNEVIAHRANQLLRKKTIDVHDDVNRGQSTNNVIPSAIRIASLQKTKELSISLEKLTKSLKKKSKQFKNILKSGRTHLQDAVPITLGQEFNAYATAISKHSFRLASTKSYLEVLGIGGTAVGTGINTNPKFRKLIIKNLNKNLRLNLKVTKDGIESTQFLTDLAALSSVLKLIAIDANKIANDLRLLSSGPKTGFNEINLPAVEPGSSIMPGKINPSILEAVNMACQKVMGNDTTITIACTSGNLELNTQMPLIGNTIIESLEILSNALKTMSERCINGITANKKVCNSYAEHSPSIATALNPYLGYDAVVKLVKTSLKSGKSVKQLVLEKKLMPKKKLDRILDPKNLTKPNLR